MATAPDKDNPSVLPETQDNHDDFESDASDDDSSSDTEKRLGLVSRFFSGQQVKIIVGQGRKQVRYLLPRDLLMERCRYFEACLTWDFKEGRASKIELSDVKPRAFRYFVHWIWTGQLENCTRRDGPDIWILADRLMCEDLRNLAMNHIQRHDNEQWRGLKEVCRICRVLPAESKLVEYSVREAVWQMCQGSARVEGEVEALLNTSLDVAKLFVALLPAFPGDGPGLKKTKCWLDPQKSVACVWDGTIGSDFFTDHGSISSAPHGELGCFWHDHQHPEVNEKVCPTPGMTEADWLWGFGNVSGALSLDPGGESARKMYQLA